MAMIDRALGDNPKEARREGYEWSKISRLLGISRQWARERFKTAPPRLPPHVVARNRYMREQRETERLVRQFRSGQLHRSEDGGDDPVAW